MFELEFDPPGSSPRLAIVTIDRPGEKMNAISPAALDQVEGILDTIEGAGDVEAVILISGKSDSFIVGADVETFANAKDRRQIEAFSRRGHAVLRRIAMGAKPVVAAIHGPALGAGLEIALACRYRVCTDSPKTVLGVPEVKLGLFPGGGGVSRLPRLIGVREALDLVLTGRSLRPRAALRMGLVDRVVEPEALLAAARDCAVDIACRRLPGRAGPRESLVRAAVERNVIGRKLLFRAARKQVEKRTFSLYPAPLVAIDIMEQGLRLPIDRALELEPAAFAELAVGEVSRSLVSLFIRSNALKKQTARGDGAVVEGADVRRLGLLGGGFMGADIATVAAESGIATRIREVDKKALERALAHVRGHFDAKGKRIGDRHVFKARSRVSGALDLEGFETFDLVIEAVPEVLAVKQDVFVELESIVGEDTVLATNTSALPLTQVGRRLRHPERFIGLHFFSPVPKMPLLEIVRHPQTAPQTLATCLRFARALGKTPIVVRDGPGFYTTRVLGFYLVAALDMIGNGHLIEDIDLGARRVGWPVGPLALLDEVGIDVGAKVSQTLADHFPDRVVLAADIGEFLTQRRFGRKSGRGFYLYPKSGRKRPDPDVYRFFSRRPEAAPAASPDELGERLTWIAAMEAVRCLEEGIVSRPRDGDVGAVFGFGYPPLRGGPFRHLDSRGLRSVVGRLKALEDRFGRSYRVPALLEQLGREGKTFADMEDES